MTDALCGAEGGMAGVQSPEALLASLAQYREQLDAVDALIAGHGGCDAHGHDDPQEDLRQVREELVEVIQLTEELAKEAAPSAKQEREKGEGGSRGGPGHAHAGDGHAGQAAPKVSSGSAGRMQGSKSALPSHLQEQIRRSQARAALTGAGPAQWAVGSRCEAFRLEANDGKGEWHEAVVRTVNGAGNFVIEFKKDRHMQEAVPECIRPHREMLREERYAPVAAPKLRKVDAPEAGPSALTDVPKTLQIKATDDERTKIRKRKTLKSLKSKQRFVEMDRAQKVKQNDWKSFMSKGKGSKKKKGFLTGRKKESIFKTSDDGRGKVGVVGSGKDMTRYNQVSRHEFGAQDE